MNQDVDVIDQMVRSASQLPPKLDLDFVSAINERQLGFTKKTHFSSAQINVTAEDELVKKQFKEKHCELPGVPRSTFLMEFSPDGTKVASTHGNHQIYVTDVRTGKHIKTLIGHPRTPWCIAFHPTSNQIIASGCLGGQVRIWDLSGGSEVWTSETPSVIASIAFHPDDRLLVIATFNELFFWDWSKPEPFVRVATASVKEKVRYVAFDKLGHKLITGITNSPQMRWERGRTVPVPVSVPVTPLIRPRRMERRIVAPRFNWPTPNNNNNTSANNNNVTTATAPAASTASTPNSEPLSSIPERERRITNCYRELVHQYEALVHRYLQIYRRPIMIDQGTDPMEIETNNQPTTSSQTTSSNTRPDSPIPSTSGLQRPSRKSTTTRPPIRRRILYCSDSGGSSSSNSSPEDNKGKTSGTQTGDTRTTVKPTPDKPKPSENYSSSSSDDDDAGSTNIQEKNSETSPTSNTDANSNPNPRQFTPARQLRLRKTEPPTTTHEETTGNTEGREPKYTRVKCFLTPRASEPGQRPLSCNRRLPTVSVGEACSAARKDDINHLIHNAKMMLTRYRDTLQQRGLQVRGVDLPELPTTSTGIGNSQPGPSNKPSKGTNTSEIEPPTTRKRRSLRPNLLGNILFTSSDDSSSDEVPETPEAPKVKTTPVPTAPSTTEHSYAGVDPPAPNQVTSGIDTRANRKRRLLNLAEYHGLATSPDCSVDVIKRRILAQTAKSDAPVGSTSNSAPPPSTTGPTSTNSLMDRQMQRLVVESLSVLDPITSDTTTLTNNTPTTTMAGRDESRLCGACGGQLEDSDTRTPEGCARTATVCTRVQPSRNTSTNLPSSSRVGPSRRRFFSHRLSAFHPTRFLHRMLRGRGSAASTRGRESPMPMNFAEDEVINYSERDAEETPTTSPSTGRSYHPFDPPPEMLSINPENIGIGSMYSNIVQELESSLNDVRNIRFRLGEMSDMLSNFSDRLENIMTQSNTILRNLSSSLEDLPANDGEQQRQAVPQSQRPSQSGFADAPTYSVIDDIMHTTPWVYRVPYANNPVNSDHTYPINPEATQNATLSPLHLSLQLTVTHIQRQARLLRQQVESIERIDRAMIEVAQLQMMRQMFDELHVHFGASSSTDNRSGVSSVRQMMAGTRISDSSPYDSPSDEGNTNTDRPEQTTVQQATTTESITATDPPEMVNPVSTAQTTQSARARCRRNYPRCLFLMHRQYLRSARRNAARDRIQMRRNIYRRFLSSSATNRAIDLSTFRGRGSLSLLFNPDTLPEMTRRVEHYLMEHCRYIGRSLTPQSTGGSSTRSDMGEHVMTLRLNNCRMRMNHLMGNFRLENNNASVTADGSSRYAARLALSSTLDTITRFVEVNPNMTISTSFRSQIWEVIELCLLLSELLLLQIVDSIPPPSGMNLDPERENLSMRIDQMCTRMISMGQSNQLARSLRLMRQTVRHATRTLGRTYTQRRNAMLPTNNEISDSRRGLLDDIHNCLRNIRRYRATDRSDDDSNFGDWYRTINDLISRYTSTGNSETPGPSTSSQGGAAESGLPSVLNSETGEEIRPPTITVEDANSSDDNSNHNDLVLTMRPTSIGLYQLGRSQEDDNDEERPNRSPNFLNVPTVQINDVPVPDAPHPWRVRSNSRLRLPERWDELRNIGLLRPRFLYSGVVNPFAFEDNLDETHREPIHDSDVIPTVTPNHRIQVWEFSQIKIPNISNSQKNLVVNECKIHNDASVDYASDGSILVTLLPSGGYMNVTNRLGVYSLEWQTLGQCLYVTSFEQNAVSVSLSPTNRHLLVGLASRRVSILPTETWTMARIFLLDYRNATHGNLSSIRELEQNRDSNFMSLNCIRWLPTAGQGLIFGTNTGHLRLLT